MSSATQDESTSRLLHFPISFFAMVMGLSGLTIAWQKTGAAQLPSAGTVLALLSSVVMLAISAIYAAKILLHRHAVVEELRHPIRLNFFPAFSISLLLLSIVWNGIPLLSITLWGCGAVLQFALTLFVMSSWIHHSHYSLSHANPSWFIPVVGNIIVPITGTALGYTELSWFFFSIGILFWLILLTIILYRLFFHEPLQARLTPMLFILLAPPSIGFISYSNLAGELDSFGRILYYTALFLGLLLLSNIIKFFKVPFFISSWAYSFPLASLTIATTKMAHLSKAPFFHILSQGLLILLSLLLLWLISRTIKAIFKGELCQPE